MGTERCCRGLAGNWACECLYGNTVWLGAPVWERSPLNTRRAETAKRSVADRSWKELALALSLAIHYAWGMLKLFLAWASSEVASYLLPGKPPQVTAEAVNV